MLLTGTIGALVSHRCLACIYYNYCTLHIFESAMMLTNEMKRDRKGQGSNGNCRYLGKALRVLLYHLPTSHRLLELQSQLGNPGETRRCSLSVLRNFCPRASTPLCMRRKSIVPHTWTTALILARLIQRQILRGCWSSQTHCPPGQCNLRLSLAMLENTEDIVSHVPFTLSSNPRTVISP